MQVCELSFYSSDVIVCSWPDPREKLARQKLFRPGERTIDSTLLCVYVMVIKRIKKEKHEFAFLQ